MTGLWVLAVFFTLYVARGFLLPIALAVVLALVFRPLVRGLARRHVPQPVTALVVLCGLTGGVIYGLSSLYTPALEWLARTPEAIYRIEMKISEIWRPVEDAGRAAESVERITGSDDEATVQVEPPSLGDRLISGALELVTSMVIVAFLLFFLLATGGRLMSRIAAFVIARKPDSRRHVELLTALEVQISRYLGTITVINACLGVAVGTALWLIGMPNPILWGVMVAFFNFIPYIGGVVGVILVALAATLSFEEPWRILAAPAAYVVLNTLEGMLFTPAVLGRRFSVDPCFVFIWLVFWTWLWGIPGGLLAMPMLAVIKIASDHVPAWNAFGRLISAGKHPMT